MHANKDQKPFLKIFQIPVTYQTRAGKLKLNAIKDLLSHPTLG